MYCVRAYVLHYNILINYVCVCLIRNTQCTVLMGHLINTDCIQLLYDADVIESISISEHGAEKLILIMHELDKNMVVTVKNLTDVLALCLYDIF